MSVSEVHPLVSNTNNYGVYDDDYVPVDEDSRNIVRRRRVLKYASVAVLLAAAAAFVGSAFHSHPPSPSSTARNSAVQADHLFAGLLADDEAFYFPTTIQEEEKEAAMNGAGRMLRALAAASATAKNQWSYDWSQNAKDGAAVGEYYRAKGLAMADYYRSKFDPTYKVSAAGNSEAQQDDTDATAATEDASTWTYDWKADMDRGISIGQHYKAIGDQINAHYREAFDPTYPATTAGDDSGARRLKSKEKKMKDRKKKELAVDMAEQADGTSASTGWYDWQSDRDRGMDIGMHYKQMGEEIADHYNQEFNPMYDVNKKAYTDKNWATMWQDYQKRGQEIADYYKSKGAAIDKFYEGKYTLEGMASPIAMDAADATTEQDGIDNDAVVEQHDTSGNNPDAAYIWGLDWQKDREHAMAIHEDMMKKGLAIGDYYRSKYDPTYGSADAVPASAKANLGSSDILEDADADADDDENDTAGAPAAGAAPAHHPDLDYPPWGLDPAADREHGIAIGQYWKQNGAATTGATYKQRGTELGKYYENKYRSQFDPTYVVAPEEDAAAP
ncbi:hypothetical protein IV203_027989 [Nitzschia inconspicua]|uniref:Uncharacterized protein n=1 Tax=Nitzschia inconspicua TaxID=303405 RepID=A0A9K3Q3X9_9STRA|nr:hypothetical protein IV203_027989 [Nitzschia inconspicua]